MHWFLDAGVKLTGRMHLELPLIENMHSPFKNRVGGLFSAR
jgi:hypothetical protein